MEKGVKVVAVNDPFIDPEYMVRSRQRTGPERGLGWEEGSKTSMEDSSCNVEPTLRWGLSRTAYGAT